MLEVNPSTTEEYHPINEMDMPNDMISEKTPLQQFYSNQCIFITGATGFLGKILLEKLLRSCPDIKRIYILIRHKDDKDKTDRINELLSDPVFSLVRGDYMQFDKKVIPISGDCGDDNLGLSMRDRDLLINEVSIVFHVAASIRFNESLTNAIAMNIRSTDSIIEICEKMPNLKSVVHVSTTYVNIFTNHIKEEFYDPPIHYEDIFQLQKSLTSAEINRSTSKLIGKWPNVYIFTKAISENLIKNKSKNLPMGIFRPSVVMPTAFEPIPGWTDNTFGIMAYIAYAMSGFLRVIHCKSDIKINIIPVDITVNALIASAWDIAMQSQKRGENMLIYNSSTINDAPKSLGQLWDDATLHARRYPIKDSIWYFILIRTSNFPLYLLYSLFFERLPMTLLDLYALIIGENPKFKKIYMKVQKLRITYARFTFRDDLLTDANVQKLWQKLNPEDKKVFHFSMKNFDWQAYTENYIKGIRKYIFHDASTSVEDDITVSKRLHRNHQIFIFLLTILTCLVAWKVIVALFTVFNC